MSGTKEQPPSVPARVSRLRSLCVWAIRLVALEQGVPIVENPPVARALFDACEIGDEVPGELYQVVARLLAFLYRLTPAQRALVDVHKMAA